MLGSPLRADLQPPVEPRPPEEVELLLGPLSRWPEAVQDAFRARVQAEWPAEESYGPIVATLGVELAWPLVTTARGGAVQVPVVEADRVALSGRLLLPPETTGPRRVVILVDASSSANAPVSFERGDGSHERISVLEAERRALEHLVAGLEGDWLEFGVIAFGESTWPVIEPGASARELRNALARFRAERPVGEGRTDAVCALWTAADWLADTPAGVGREIVVLTDGDAPVSGRFAPGNARNQAPCPASHALSRADGPSDPLALARFARQMGRSLVVTPLIFEPERRALPWRKLAERAQGRLVRVPGAAAIDAVLPALVARRIGRVTARNATTGAVTGELRQPDGDLLAGSLPLAAGANDVELRVESDRGTAALFRFRIYSAPNELERALAELRAHTSELEARAAALDAAPEAARRRSLELAAPPAAPAR